MITCTSIKKTTSPSFHAKSFWRSEKEPFSGYHKRYDSDPELPGQMLQTSTFEKKNLGQTSIHIKLLLVLEDDSWHQSICQSSVLVPRDCPAHSLSRQSLYKQYLRQLLRQIGSSRLFHRRRGKPWPSKLWKMKAGRISVIGTVSSIFMSCSYHFTCHYVRVTTQNHYNIYSNNLRKWVILCHADNIIDTLYICIT